MSDTNARGYPGICASGQKSTEWSVNMLRYLTAGESHGPQLTAIVEGLPAGLKISEDLINQDLERRQGGYGRGGRMQIEKDAIDMLSGVRWGETIGSPVTLVVRNRDWENWQEKMSPKESYRDEKIRVTRSRPGHADLPGVMKYGHRDVRNILERSSARETAVRVAVGALAKALLAEFGIAVFGYVVELGELRPSVPPRLMKDCETWCQHRSSTLLMRLPMPG